MWLFYRMPATNLSVCAQPFPPPHCFLYTEKTLGLSSEWREGHGARFLPQTHQKTCGTNLQNTYKRLEISYNQSSNLYVTGRMKGKGEEELGRDLHVWARAVEERSLGRSLLRGRQIGGDREGTSGAGGRGGAHGAEGHRRTATEGPGRLPALPARDAYLLACAAPGCG